MRISKKYFSIDYLIALLLVLSGGSVAFVFNRNALTILLFLLILFGLASRHNKIRTSSFKPISLSLLVLIVFLVVNFLFGVEGQSYIKFGFLFFSFFIALFSLLYFETKNVQILSLFRGVLVLVMFHSVVNFFAYPFIKSNLSVIVNPFNEYTCSTFNYLFYYMPSRNELSIMGMLFCRNQGIFWEPGVLQIFLNLLFFIEAFVSKQKKSIIVWLTLLAIILTYSTTGIVILAIQLVVFFWKQIRRNLLLAPIFLVLAIPFYQLAQQNIEDKITGEGSTSANVRLYDLVQQVYISLDYPITGVGLDDQVYKIKRAEYALNIDLLEFEALEKGSSNSLLFMMAAGGIPFTLYLLYCLFKQTIVQQKKVLFFVLILLSFMSEPIMLKPFFLLFLMQGSIQLFKKYSW